MSGTPAQELAEKGGVYIDDLDPENRRILDHRPTNIVRYAYPKEDKINRIATAALIINRMIGSGIFSTPSTILRATNSVGVSLLFWSIGILLAFAGLSVYLELGLTIPRRILQREGENEEDLDIYVPRNGGEKNYLEWIYRHPRSAATCIYGIVFICLGSTAANANIVSTYALQVAGNDHPSRWVTNAYAILAITLACLLHGVWRKGGIWVMTFFAGLKILILLFVIVLGFMVATHRTAAEPSLDNFHNAFSGPPSDPYGYAVALLSIRFAFAGFENANYVLTEVDHPEEKLPSSSMTAVGIVSILYLLTNIAYFLVVPKAQMQQAGTKVAVQFFAIIFGEKSRAAQALPALVCVSAFGALIAATFVSAKVKQEIAKEGVLPFSKFWSRQYNLLRGPAQEEPEDQTGETPIPALVLHWIVSVVLVLSPPTKDSYSLLSNFYAYTIGACIGSLLAGGLVFWAYIYPRTRTEWKKLRGFKPFLGPALPTIYLLASTFMVIAAFIPPHGELLITPTIPWYIFPTVGLCQFGVGIIYWAVFYYIVPWYRDENLFVKRTPVFRPEGLGQVFVLESVESKWVTRGSEHDEPGPISKIY